MNDLVAIDILVEPDEAALARARAANARMRDQYPDGFQLDALHTPHITLLQRYVASDRIERVCAAAQAVLRRQDVLSLTFEASEIRHMPVEALPGIGLAAIVAMPGPDVLAMQAALIEALAPHTRQGGTAAAFVTTAQEPEINADTLRYVERYVPDHSGPNYIAHMTVGLAPLDYLASLEADPFDGFAFLPIVFAVFKLGNNGTAQEMIHRWEATGSR